MPVGRSSIAKSARIRGRMGISPDSMPKSVNRSSFIASGELYSQMAGSSSIGPLTPKEAGAVTWHAAHAITGVADGAALASVTGLITTNGTTSDLAQGTGGKQPLYIAKAWNQRPCIRFDGIDDRLDGNLGGTGMSGKPFVLMIVGALRATSGTQQTFWCGNFSSKVIYFSANDKRVSALGSTSAIINPIPVQLNVPFLMTLQTFLTGFAAVGETGSQGVLRLNGEIDGASSIPTLNAPTFGMDLNVQNFGIRSDDVLPCAFDLYEACYFVKVPNDPGQKQEPPISQRTVAAVEQYLLQTYGI